MSLGPWYATDRTCARIGLWDPFKNGRLRASGLIFYDQLLPKFMYFGQPQSTIYDAHEPNKSPISDAVQGFNANAPVCGVPGAQREAVLPEISRPISRR